jgi:hypothetical protein
MSYPHEMSHFVFEPMDGFEHVSYTDSGAKADVGNPVGILQQELPDDKMDATLQTRRRRERA